MHYSHEPDLKASILLVSESDNEGGRDKENQGRANRFIEKKYRNVVQGEKKSWWLMCGCVFVHAQRPEPKP